MKYILLNNALQTGYSIEDYKNTKYKGHVSISTKPRNTTIHSMLLHAKCMASKIRLKIF